MKIAVVNTYTVCNKILHVYYYNYSRFYRVYGKPGTPELPGFPNADVLNTLCNNIEYNQSGECHL